MSSTQFIFDASFAVVKLAVLNAEGEHIAWASGVVVEETDFLSLYTCWHVVTGSDPHKLPADPPPKRTKIRVHTVLHQEQAGGTVIMSGGLNTFEIDLYNPAGKFVWFQGEAQEGCEQGDIPPPHWDCVRINIEDQKHQFRNTFRHNDLDDHGLSIGDDAFIVGHPYGYSAGDSPHPIFIRRTPCSLQSPRYFELLDGCGAKGMSGGAILTKRNGSWLLKGIYNGAIFPEAQHFGQDLHNQTQVSRLPLGKFTHFNIARAVCGAHPTPAIRP